MDKISKFLACSDEDRQQECIVSIFSEMSALETAQYARSIMHSRVKKERYLAAWVLGRNDESQKELGYDLSIGLLLQFVESECDSLVLNRLILSLGQIPLRRSEEALLEYSESFDGVFYESLACAISIPRSPPSQKYFDAFNRLFQSTSVKVREWAAFGLRLRVEDFGPSTIPEALAELIAQDSHLDIRMEGIRILSLFSESNYWSYLEPIVYECGGNEQLVDLLEYIISRDQEKPGSS